MADAMFAPLLARLLPHCSCVRHVVLLAEERGMPNSGTSSCIAAAAAANRPNAVGGGGVGVPGALCYEALLQEHVAAEPAFRWEVPGERAAAGLCYTSGTTGRPKVRSRVCKGWRAHCFLLPRWCSTHLHARVGDNAHTRHT